MSHQPCPRLCREKCLHVRECRGRWSIRSGGAVEGAHAAPKQAVRYASNQLQQPDDTGP